MIITLKDRTELYLPKEKGDILEKALIEGTAPDFIKINGTLVRKDFIAKLQQGGVSPTPIKDESRLIAQPEITDEQRAKNIEKLAKIRADFNKKRLAKNKVK